MLCMLIEKYDERVYLRGLTNKRKENHRLDLRIRNKNVRISKVTENTGIRNQKKRIKKTLLINMFVVV